MSRRSLFERGSDFWKEVDRAERRWRTPAFIILSGIWAAVMGLYQRSTGDSILRSFTIARVAGFLFFVATWLALRMVDRHGKK